MEASSVRDNQQIRHLQEQEEPWEQTVGSSKVPGMWSKLLEKTHPHPQFAQVSGCWDGQEGAGGSPRGSHAHQFSDFGARFCEARLLRPEIQDLLTESFLLVQATQIVTALGVGRKVAPTVSTNWSPVSPSHRALTAVLSDTERLVRMIADPKAGHTIRKSGWEGFKTISSALLRVLLAKRVVGEGAGLDPEEIQAAIRLMWSLGNIDRGILDFCNKYGLPVWIAKRLNRLAEVVAGEEASVALLGACLACLTPAQKRHPRHLKALGTYYLAKTAKKSLISLR